MSSPSLKLPYHHHLIAWRSGCLLVLLALMLLLPELAHAKPIGPDTQPSPLAIARHTDKLSIVIWGLVFVVLTCLGPLVALFYFASDTTSGYVKGGMIYATLNQVSQGKRLDPWAAYGAGVANYLLPPIAVILIGPFGLYELTIKPILLRTDDANATVCCYSYGTSLRNVVLSNDGRWLLGHASEWTLFGEHSAAGNVFLVDTTAGGFVEFKAKDGSYSPFWRVAEGIKGVSRLEDVTWDAEDGRYLRADYEREDRRRENTNRYTVFETYDLKRIGLGPMRIDQPMSPVAENFRLESYVNETATFASFQRTVELDVGGDTLSVDSSGTIAAVIAYDAESWVDSAKLAFWHLPTGQRIREYKVRYMPTDPRWKVSYGGDVWVYLIDDHIKIFRPTEGWSPPLSQKGVQANKVQGTGSEVLKNPWLDS